MGAMLVECADRYDEAWIMGQSLDDIDPTQPV
jgi:hypothetical protein